jgi:trimeric autotransporter adhesin
LTVEAVCERFYHHHVYWRFDFDVRTSTGGCGGDGGDGGSATNASLNSPYDVVLDSAGNLYIADNGGCRVRRVSGGIITTVAGNGSCNYGGDGGLATSASLGSPTGVALDGAGNLYIGDFPMTVACVR